VLDLGDLVESLLAGLFNGSGYSTARARRRAAFYDRHPIGRWFVAGALLLFFAACITGTVLILVYAS